MGLTDGKKSIRVVRFDTKNQQKLAHFKIENKPVAIVNCEVKEGKLTPDLEIHIYESPLMFRSRHLK